MTSSWRHHIPEKRASQCFWFWPKSIPKTSRITLKKVSAMSIFKNLNFILTRGVWRQDSGDKTLATRLWRQNFGDKTLVTRLWQQDFGDKTLATRLWQQDFGDKTLATRLWRQDYGDKTLATRFRQQDLIQKTLATKLWWQEFDEKTSPRFQRHDFDDKSLTTSLTTRLWQQDSHNKMKLWQ